MSTNKGMKRAVPGYEAAESGSGSELVESMGQAVARAKKESGAARVSSVMVPTVDVKAIRRRLGLSQAKFAARFGFAPASVRNWEQGRRVPDGPARILLAVIGEYPGMVESVLRKAG